MKRVVVTGASGFIGRAAILTLKERGFEVHSVGRSSVFSDGVVFHKADLLDPNQISDVVGLVRPRFLLHLAWYTEPKVYWTSPLNLDWVSASLHLLRCFVESGGKRAVIAGTCAEYEWSAPLLDEAQSVCKPATFYGASKDGLRRISEAYARASGFSLAWGRIFYLYGPFEKRGRLVSDAITHLLAGQTFPTSSGFQKRDFLHVDDAARALISVLESSIEGGVNIGSGQATAVRDVLELVGTYAGRPDLLLFGERHLSANEPDIIEASVDRLSRDVGFRPRYTLSDGIGQTVEWWRNQEGHGLGRSPA